MKSKFESPLYKKLFMAILLVSSGLRLFNLDWDLGHYLHPDERLYINASNLTLPASWSEFLSPSSPLNPHMFYYGSLPLYIYVFFSKVIEFIAEKPVSILFFSRAISAILSCLTTIFVWKLSKKLFHPLFALVATLLYAFSIGSIQYAHYNTTESALTFFAVVLTYVGFEMYRKSFQNSFFISIKQYIGFALINGIVLGCAIATKITGASFAIIPALTFGLIFLKSLQKKKSIIIKNTVSFIVLGLLLLSLTAAIGFFGSPYNIIDYPSFQKEQSYMQGVILGKYKPPFTIIYENTPKYLYQLTMIFPWIFSPFFIVFAVLGFVGIWKESLIRLIKIKNNSLDLSGLLLIVWPTIYLITVGAWYAKFTRYMIPLLPFLAIYTTWFLSKLISKVDKKSIRSFLFSFLAILLVWHLITSLSFTSQMYGKTHTRLSASEWIYKTIPTGAMIGVEHWDDALPLPLPQYDRQSYTIKELTVYDPDTPTKVEALVQKVSQSDYLVFSSRRVYYSIQKNSKQYPATSEFYNKLFAGNLGFELIHREERFPFFPLQISDDMADESFQSYDHPPVVIFKNKNHLSSIELKNLLPEAPLVPPTF